jgi:type IV pilus assembly protein PilY1
MKHPHSIAARVLACLMAGTQLIVPPALAATAPPTAVTISIPAISDQPLYTVATVPPNLVLTLDNSGSMVLQYAPLSVLSNLTKACYTNTAYNRLYYDPTTTYVPPAKADGTRFPDASYTAAWRNGYVTSLGTYNLSTDFPGLTNYGVGNTSGSPYRTTGIANRGAYYHAYTGASPASPVLGTCYPDASYTVVDMNAATPAQQQNFANWFSYYRTRMDAMKTAVSEAFRYLDGNFRVGLHTINNPAGTDASGVFLPVESFTGTARSTWYTRFQEQRTGGGTPLRAATERIGEYFRAGTSPAGGTVPDPIQYSCQQNYHLLTTDGEWNGAGATGTVGSTNWNRTLPNNPALLTALSAEFGTTVTAGQNWPAPYRENDGTASTNSLADIAAYYWQTDLRPTMANNVFTSKRNPANWQHMVSFGLAFAAQGEVAFPNGIDAIRAGTAQWPVPTNDSPRSVDDLWASAVVGHGMYFNVFSPPGLTDALARAITEIQSRQGSGSGAVVSTRDLSVGSPLAFRAMYRSGEWSGDVQARNIDPSTGTISPVAVWSAAEKLLAQVEPSGAGGGWSTNRRIATRTAAGSSGTAVRFREPGFGGAGGAISTAQANTLTGGTVNAAQQKKIIEYLRGDRSNEDTSTVTREFRQRVSVLADIVGSEPRFVGVPSESYLDSYHPGYASFRTTHASRSPTLYVGSNGGMLHAIEATMGVATSGAERWAYVPSFMFSSGVEGLQGQVWRETDPVPTKYEHRFRVDGTPMVRDVNFGRVAGVGSVSTDWRTLLVGGLGKGGRGYYALDVTSPLAADEQAVVSKVLWEFDGSSSGDQNRVGYSFGQPMALFTAAGWVVAVSSGYQNATGTGHVWLLDPRNGSVIKRLDVPDNSGASTAAPIGLAHMEAYFQDDREQRVLQLYATDLRGNVWRWDLSGNTVSSWGTNATKVAAVGAPITTSPALAINPANPSERWVLFGTGQLLSAADTGSTATRTLYAVKDGGPVTPASFSTALGRGDLQSVSLTGTATVSETTKGWYIDMPSGGQIVVPPFVARGVVIWGVTIPSSDPCSPGANSYLYARELGTAGNRISNGNTSIAVSAPMTKVQTILGGGAAGGTSSQRKLLAIGSTSASDVQIDVNLRVMLTGGRSNLRFVTRQ